MHAASGGRTLWPPSGNCGVDILKKPDFVNPEFWQISSRSDLKRRSLELFWRWLRQEEEQVPGPKTCNIYRYSLHYSVFLTPPSLRVYCIVSPHRNIQDDPPFSHYVLDHISLFRLEYTTRLSQGGMCTRAALSASSSLKMLISWWQLLQLCWRWRDSIVFIAHISAAMKFCSL